MARSSCDWPTCDGSYAATALLGKELSEAIGAERLLFTARELLTGQRSVASVAGETLAMPRRVLVSNAAFVDHLSP